jgi:hypothetical protein
LLNSLRSPSLSKESISEVYRRLQEIITDNIEKIETVEGLKIALKMFAPDPSIIKVIDGNILKLGDKLTTQDWVALLNTKSILRQKNLSVLSTCALNIIKRKDVERLDLNSIKSCLLSCGILSYYENQFFKVILEQLASEVTRNKNDSAWLKSNLNHLSVIIKSLGILKLKDDACLDALSSLLNENKSELKKDLIVSFVVSCATVSYKPNAAFKELVNHVKPRDFDAEKNKLTLLNFVWSLCALGETRPELITLVLESNFWQSLLNGWLNFLKLYSN